jgi:hypothetical protein
MHDRRRHCDVGFRTESPRSHLQCLQSAFFTVAISAISIGSKDQPLWQRSQSLGQQTFLPSIGF